MVQSGEYIQSFDKTKIFCRSWDKIKDAKGMVLLIHGMVEHCARYNAFAKFLNKNGYIVFSWDLRAHGQTVGNPENVGKYDKKDLYADCVQDAIFFAERMHKKYNLPLVVMGHSFGSFVLQGVVQKYHNFKCATFVGSACMAKNAGVPVGLFVAGCTKFFCGKNAKAKLIYRLTFKNYEKNFEDGNWLTRDKQIFKAYKADPYCQAICSANFYHSFFKNLKKIYKKKNLQNVDKNIPILIVSGDHDPVGGYGKLVKKLEKQYKDLGVKSVQMKLFKGGRHEILNETNKDEVWNVVLNFIQENT